MLRILQDGCPLAIEVKNSYHIIIVNVYYSQISLNTQPIIKVSVPVQ